MMSKFMRLGGLMLYLALALLPLSGWADTRRVINYQGKLTSAEGEPLNLETEICFRIYPTATGGSAIWSETRMVTVTDGIFNVLLGEVTPLAVDYFTAASSHYLGIQVGGDEEMTPRMEMATVARSIRSEVADIAQDLTPSARQALLELVYPVGAIYISTVSTNPATLFGFGSWSTFGAGRVPVGYQSNDSDFNSPEKTGGAKTHTLTVNEIPSHSHDVRQRSNSPTPYSTFYNSNYSGGAAEFVHTAASKMISSGSTDNLFTLNVGGGRAHNNLQPYIVVYMWKRVS